MNERDEGKEKRKDRKFSQEQYDMLLRCSDKKDITEWNEWRKNNPDKEVLLEGAPLYRAHLDGADFSYAHLEHADLTEAHLEGANFYFAHLESAILFLAHLEEVELDWTHIEDANLAGTHMEDVHFSHTFMKNANLEMAHLEGAYLNSANLEGAFFFKTIFDNETIIWNCPVDKRTDFRGVGLGNIRIDHGTRALLEYNIRRMNWEDWYKEKWYRRPVKLFWWVSDYGMSTPRILAVFSLSAIGFALLYYLWGLFAPPGIVQNLLEIAGAAVPWYVVPFRALYFSVVTMTTLGFGDLHANPFTIWGHVFLAFQVILGYVILGALITRLNILFTTGGPSGDFAKPNKPPKQE